VVTWWPILDAAPAGCHAGHDVSREQQDDCLDVERRPALACGEELERLLP